MYSNNILNFQESTTILNACTKKKSGHLLKAPRTTCLNSKFSFSSTGYFTKVKEGRLSYYLPIVGLGVMDSYISLGY